MSLMITMILVCPVSRCSTRVDRVRRLVWDNDRDGLELERCFLDGFGLAWSRKMRTGPFPASRTIS